MAIIQARKTKKGLKPGEYITISAQDYSDVFPQSENNVYRSLREATNTLYEKSFHFISVSPNTGIKRTESHRWLASKAIYKENHALIEFAFTPLVLEHIDNLEKHFTQYAIEKIAQMTSVYAIRLYEILIQYHNKGKYEVELEIAYLQALFELEDKYKLLKNLKARVIDPAANQINEYSDLTIKLPYGQRKLGRNITHFVFKFALKPGQEKIQTVRNATQSISKPKIKNKPIKEEIATVELPQVIKAISTRLADQEDW